MKKAVLLIIIIICTYSARSQSPLMWKIDEKSTLQFNLGLDTYFAYDARSAEDDDIVLRDMAGTCSYNDEIRLNLVYFGIQYNSENIHSKIAWQHGDAPLIMAPDEKKFIKFLKQASFGVKLFDRMWLDLGYMGNPIGIESSELRKNILSTVSGPGFMDPGNMLGASLNYQVSATVSAQLSYFNSFSIVAKNNKNKSLGWMLSYAPNQDLTILYAGQAGDEATKNEASRLQIFNSLMLMYNITPNLKASAQYDFVSQQNSHRTDTTQTGYYFAGLASLKYQIDPKFSVAARVEFFNDPDGFISGGISDSKAPFTWQGFSTGVEYKPSSNSFLRAEYQWVQANQGIFQMWDRTRRSIVISSGFWL